MLREYKKYPMEINGNCVGVFEANTFRDYNIDFKTIVKGDKSNIYLIAFNHLDDYDFYAIYKEVHDYGLDNYYLIDSDMEEIACVPDIYDITKYEHLIDDYSKNRRLIINDMKASNNLKITSC